MYKVDLHMHSILSYDGGMSVEDIDKIFSRGLLDYIAITDHGEIGFALDIKEKYGDKLIIGEEMHTEAGDVIGLFLKEKIPNGLSVTETIDLIKKQDGIVYIPHPFDIKRSAIGKANSIKHKDDIDLFEVFNARSFLPGDNKLANKLADQLHLAKVAGSDSHALNEIGRTYNILNKKITRENFLEQFKEAELQKSLIRPWHIFNPKLNKIKKKRNG